MLSFERRGGLSEGKINSGAVCRIGIKAKMPLGPLDTAL